MRKIHFNNRIWIFTALLILLFLSAAGAKSALASNLALEQKPRCGMEEHVHTADCYVGDVLVCGKKMHTHTEKCYLVLLKDNDINTLLTTVESSKDRSLESVIWNTVVNAAQNWHGQGGREEPSLDSVFSEAISPLDPIPSALISALKLSSSPSPSASTLDLLVPLASGTDTEEEAAGAMEEEIEAATSADIARLNEAAAAMDVQPRVTLNEGLVTQSASEKGGLNEEELLNALLNGGSGISSTYAASGGASTYAVGDKASTANNTVSFFIRLNGDITCIGSYDFIIYPTGNRMYYVDDVVSIYNSNSIVSSLTTDNINTAGYYIRYNTEQQQDSFDKNATYKKGWYSDYFEFTKIKNPQFVLLSKSKSNLDPVDFYTVNIVYPDSSMGTNSTQYVEEGLSVPLSDEYFWTDETGAEVSGSQTITDGPKTFTARAKNVTITLLDQSGVYYGGGPNLTYNGSYTLPDLPAGANRWVDTASGTIYPSGETITNIKKNMTFQAALCHTVTYYDTDGNFITSGEVVDGEDFEVTQDPGTGYLWAGSDGMYYFSGGTISNVTGDLTLTKKQYHTVTYTYEDGSEGGVSYIVLDGASHSVDPVKAGYAWFKGGALFTASTISSVTEDIILTGVKAWTVTLKDTGGSTQTETVYNGHTYILPSLPSGYLWKDGGGTRYSAGSSVTISADTTFTAVQADPLNVTYDVNFSVGSGLSSPSTTPTLVGSSPVTVTAGSDYTVNTVSDRTVNCPLTYSPSRNGTAYFVGWQTETGAIIQPSVKLTWDELSAYDKDGDGTVALTGVWNSHMLQSVNFFVEYKAGTADPGSASAYTPMIFTTYVGGIDSDVAGGASQSSLNSAYAINNGSTFIDENGVVQPALYWDNKVRALYGGSTVPWLAEFPSDTYIFEQLKQYADSLLVPVEGKFDASGNQVYEQVNVNDLNEYGYAIRWYTFKVAADYGSAAMTWHIDGRLVRKVGKVNTAKTFAGNEKLVDAAKDGFYITAVNTPGDGETQKLIIMTLTEADSTEQARILAKLGKSASDVTAWITPIDDGDGNANTYLWQFDDVKYNEQWTITEHPPDVTDIAKYNEWIIVDSSALGQSDTGQGGTVSVSGVTQASDLEDPEWLRAEFNNIYYLNNSLMMKKEDGSTGQALSGAEFELWQDGKLITFDYNEGKGLYERNSAGTGALRYLTSGGYLNISLEGFSYDAGDIIFKEITTPSGYETVGEVRVGYLKDSNGDYVIGEDGDKVVGVTNGAAFAQYHDGLVIIQNNASLKNVTAKKEWNCDTSEQGPVRVQLLANGDANLAARLLTGKKDAEGNPVAATVTLTDAGGWSYTWEDMPLYANGERITYSIRELKIGDETCKADYSFANWITGYQPAVTDSSGNITLVVENTPKRPMLNLYKTDTLGRPLAGALFELVEVDGTGTPAGTAKTGFSDDKGALSFDNLRYGAIYRLTERSAPTGYWAFTEAAYLTIAEDGKVTVGTGLDASGQVTGSHGYVSASSTYTITAKNRSADALPETGGGGTTGYYATGVMLMLLALCVAILPQIKRKGRYRMRR